MTTARNTTTPIRTMIVDDHSIVRDGISQALEESGLFCIVGQASDGVEATRLAGQLDPELIIMDVIMPNKDGVEACRDIMSTQPSTRVIIFTASTEDDAIIEAVAAGATGYLPKEANREQLLSTAKRVADGEIQIPPHLIQEVFAGIRGTERPRDRQRNLLTQREREILTAFAKGMSYAEIAQDRQIRPTTARNAIYGIQHKLDINTMQELVVWAVRNGLLDDYTRA